MLLRTVVRRRRRRRAPCHVSIDRLAKELRERLSGS